MADSVARSPIEQTYSHKLDESFSIQLCEEDMVMIARRCRELGFKPPPRTVGRSLLRFANDSIEQGLVTIHSIYSVYNADAISLALDNIQNPVREIRRMLEPANELVDPADRTMFAEYCKYHGMTEAEAIRKCVALAMWVFKGTDFDYRWGTNFVEAESEEKRA